MRLAIPALKKLILEKESNPAHSSVIQEARNALLVIKSSASKRKHLKDSKAMETKRSDDKQRTKAGKRTMMKIRLTRPQDRAGGRFTDSE